MTDPTSAPTTDATTVVSARRFDAPRAALWDALTDPTRLARWWGPAGFTSVFETFDLRPGGAWRVVMRGPDGAEYAMDKAFVVVAPGERLVVAHLQEGHRFDQTMELADDAGGTRLTWTMRFASAAELAPVREAIVVANEQNFDRLAAELAAAPAPRSDRP